MSLALPQTFRITTQNSTGQIVNSIAATLTLDRPGSLHGEVKYRRLAAASVLNVADVANAAYSAGSTISNAPGSASEGGYYGMTCQVSVVANTSTPSGNVNVYLDVSNDGGTTWDSNGQGKLLGAVPITGANATAVVKTFHF